MHVFLTSSARAGRSTEGLLHDYGRSRVYLSHHWTASHCVAVHGLTAPPGRRPSRRSPLVSGKCLDVGAVVSDETQPEKVGKGNTGCERRPGHDVGLRVGLG